MTLGEKLDEIVLRYSGSYENVNTGVPRLCIPSLALQDGPSGLAFGDRGVTQLPAPIGVAASFATGLASEYGQVLGEEAAGQGIDVVQGPDLNIERVPESGRGFDGFGEDPLLVSGMGNAEIEGVQSQKVMADAKHLAVYSQETNRGALDNTVTARSLQEIYLRPFESAVADAGVASLMCAYPLLNGVFQCEDSSLLQNLRQWGFAGFVRSDNGAVHDPASALEAGTDLLKPASIEQLTAQVSNGSLPVSAVDTAVERVLTQMFAYGLVGRQTGGVPGTKVDSPEHAAVALKAAERSVVLLRNRQGSLPLDPSSVRSVAVIGAAASDAPVPAGFGSSHVIAPFVSTPLSAIKDGLGRAASVSYADGGSTTAALPVIPATDLSPLSGLGHGLTMTIGHLGAPAGAMTVVDPVAAAAARTGAQAGSTPNSVKRNPPAVHKPGSGAVPADRPSVAATANGIQIVLPARWGPSAVTWSGTLRVPRSGMYSLSMTGSGSANVSIDGRVVVDDSVTHGPGTWSGTAELTAGRPYQFRASWAPLDNGNGNNSRLTIGMKYDSDAIAAAVATARSAHVAVVFAADSSGETFDRPSLDLPGDQDALISAVAAANPNTIVVLDTSGPVLMPWLNQVSSVLEAWYPGEQDGAAIAAVLLGQFDPSGHLPVTFPASQKASATSSPTQWPGTGLLSAYSEGLDVGYRYYQQTGIRPLFAFGFGLSYTSFNFGRLRVSTDAAGVHVSVKVTNGGHRIGGDVVQAYLTYPATAGEPPGQLVSFSPVTLAAGSSTVVRMTIPRQTLETYQPSGWTVIPGHYSVGLGDSSGFQALHTSFTFH